MKAAEEISQLLDDHIVMTQSMSFSPYKKPFENRIMNWESKLRMTQDVMEEWATCQRAWLYLEPIFSSEDINRYVNQLFITLKIVTFSPPTFNFRLIYVSIL